LSSAQISNNEFDTTIEDHLNDQDASSFESPSFLANEYTSLDLEDYLLLPGSLTSSIDKSKSLQLNIRFKVNGDYLSTTKEEASVIPSSKNYDQINGGLEFTTEKEAVKAVLKKYKEILESLDATKSYALFTEDSQVLEQGKIEGTYRDYIANHIGPELCHFSSFTFSEYEIEVQVDLPYAFTTETYIYNIVLKEDDRRIERKASATSILKKQENGSWRIIKTHSSSRAVK
jgi:uncharacterized protein (TIGR02246 family)